MEDFVTWKTDPLLIDDVTKNKNSWQTANSLIGNNLKNRMFLQQGILNLYSIIVRKQDFLTSNRLLQTLPYITLPVEFAQQLRKTTLNLAESCYHYFTKTPLDYSIKKWQAKLVDYLDNQFRLPFPLFRLSDHWQGFLSMEYVPFQSARGEQFHLPTRLTNDLAYFLGVVIGDGHLNYHNIVLVDYLQDQMINLQTLAQQLFGIEGPVTGENKVWLLHLNNKWLVRLSNFLTDQPITGKKYHALREPLIFQMDENLRWQFWSGVLDADGSYKQQVNFCSSSEFFVKEFANVLEKHNIEYTPHTIKSDLGIGYSLVIKAFSKETLSQYLHPRHPIKKQEFLHYLSKKGYKKSINYIALDFNPNMLISINDVEFFDFSLLNTFHVVGCAKFLRMVRKVWAWTQQELASYLIIPKSQLASYEYRDNLPIPLLEKLLPKIPDAPKSLMPFLVANKLEYFRSRRAVARLDLQPNKELLALVKKLSMRRGYLFVRSAFNNNPSVLKEIAGYFDLLTTSTQLQNSVLQQYLKTFFKVIVDEN